MYNVKSMQASEFIAHDEILETLAYASANKNNASLIDSIIAKERNARDFHTGSCRAFRL